MPVVTNVEDLRQLAKKRVAKAIFDYVDRGSYDEATLRANRADLELLTLRQRVAIDVDRRSLRTTLVGHDVTMPVAIAPTGLAGLNWADGEMLGARAAERFGVPFTLSTMSICSIEDVASAVAKPFWFQLYVMRDRGFAASLIERARAAKCSALVLTLDLQVQGQRHQDLKNGLAVPPRLTLGTFLDVLTKPSWAFNVLRGRRKSFGNLEGRRVGEEALGREADPEGHPRRRGREDRRLERRRRDRGLQPRRPAARRHRVVDPRAARSGQRGGRPNGSAVRRRHPLRPGRAQGARARRARRHDRPRFSLRPGRDGGKGRDARAGNHPQRARRDDGAVRVARRQGREPGDPAALNSEKQLRPASFERYIAASALFISVSWSALSSGYSAAPMLTVASSESPSTWKGAWNAARIFCATSATSAGAERRLSTTANSSPPRRATVSEARTDFASRSAASRSSLSPAACPSVSLTLLK